MFSIVVDFVNLLLAALLVGAMFGVWLIFNPSRLAAHVYITLQQQAIRTLNTAMPMLGATTILFTISAAVLGRGDSARLVLLVGTVICFVSAGLITRFLNQPINAVVMTWRIDAPPAKWGALRDEWWRWHLARLAA